MSWMDSRRKFGAAVLLAGMTVGAHGQAAPAAGPKPDVSGTWKLNLTKSQYGQVPSPSAASVVLTEAGDDFKEVVTTSGELGTLTYTVNYKAGGDYVPLAKDSFPAGAVFSIASAKAEWQGKVLLVSEKAFYQGDTVGVLARYMLSDDGKTLTKLINYSTSQGDFDVSEVYDKV